MKKILLGLIITLSGLMADFSHLSAEQVQKMLDDKVVVVDIRTPMEWAETGVVPGSKLIEFFDMTGQYDIEKWMGEFEKYVTSKEQPFVLVCRTASRTKIVGNFLAQMLGYKHVNELDGGVVAWHHVGKTFQKIK